jgi:hypothetical protein
VKKDDKEEIAGMLAKLPAPPAAAIPEWAWTITALSAIAIAVTLQNSLPLTPQYVAEQAVRHAILLSLHAPDWWRQLADVYDADQERGHTALSAVAAGFAALVDEAAEQLKASTQ